MNYIQCMYCQSVGEMHFFDVCTQCAVKKSIVSARNLGHRECNPSRYRQLDKWEEIGACVMFGLMLVCIFAF